MKSIIWVVACLIIVSSGIAFAADANSLEFEFTSIFYSKYVWRGINVNDDYVFQQNISTTYKGFTASVWGNLDMTDYAGEKSEFSEIDYTFDYTATISVIEGVSYSVGLINYHFPGLVGDTTEVYLGLTFDLPLNPSITVYHDIDEVDGTYASFSLSHSFDSIFELSPDTPVGLDVGASLGYGSSSYNDSYWGVDSDAVNDITLSVALPVKLGGWTFSPSLNYSILMDRDIRASNNSGRRDDYLFTGISLSKSF